MADSLSIHTLVLRSYGSRETGQPYECRVRSSVCRVRVIAATTTHPKVDNEQTTGPIYSHVAVRHNAGLEIHIHFSTVKPSSPAEPLGAVPIGSGGAA
jgi:hypothetical protein